MALERSPKTRSLLFVVVVLLALLTVFYSVTAVVWGEELALKPFHGVYPFYGSGEEGAWQRSHPGKPLPWWLTGSYVRLLYTPRETTVPSWTLCYLLGYWLVLLGWLCLGLMLLLKRLRRQNRPHDPRG